VTGRIPGIVVVAVMVVLAAGIILMRDLVVRGPLDEGLAYGSAARPAGPVGPLPRFPFESMEPQVRAQFSQAARRAEQEPDAADANGDLGTLFQAYGFNGMAVTCYERAVALAPGDWRWRYRLGVVLVERAEWPRAIVELDHVLAERPEHVTVLLYRAEASRRCNRLDDALAGYQRVIELLPQCARAWGGAGQVAMRQGDLAAAEQSLREALRLVPEYGPARYALGQVLRRQGHLDDAARELAAAQQQRELEPPLDPALAQALATLRVGAIDALHRGIDLARAGDLEQAITLFEESVRVDPDLAEAHSQLGAAHLAVGNTAAARTHLQRALQLDPDFADARYNLGLLAHREGRFDDAVAHFQQAVAIRPEHFDARLGLGTDLVRVGRPEQAIDHLRRATALRPDDPRSYKRLAAVLSDQGDYRQAADVLRLAVQRLPGDASIADRLAWLLATCPEVRDPAAALAIAQDVIRRTGDSEPRALVTLAAALAAVGRFDEAVEVALRARELAESTGRESVSAAIQRHLEAYRARRAWREFD
jgi:tetratricopeptide (TPR) repeat protein